LDVLVVFVVGVLFPIHRHKPEPEDHSPFHYLDTASSRVDINAVTAKLELDKPPYARCKRPCRRRDENSAR
jgi:hypothetical protein